tara:strand:+ start:3106 stop:4545 length:1440 start_codon:yes stop_codon:yes gene_type:complete
MNVLTKTLLFSLVLSLIPLVSKVVVPDYEGFNLQAADDSKKKKRKRVKLPSKKAQKILQTVQPLLETEDWEAALYMLSVIETDPKFTGADRARMLWYYGYIYFSQEKYDSAISVYKRLLNEPEADWKIQNQARYSLAQLSFIQEDYRGSIKYLLEWIQEEEEPSAQGYSLLATAYFQTEDFKRAKINIETAIEMAESRDIPITVKNEEGEEVETGETKKGVARENDYLLKMAIYTELKQKLDVLPIYEILVQHYPKKRYWTGLASLYGSRDRHLDQLGALEAAYEDKLLDKQREYVALGQLLFMHQNPHKAAIALEHGFMNGFVKDEEKTLKALAQYWHAAKELKKAKPAYQKAAALSKKGELYIFLGQVHFGLDEFGESEKAIRAGIKKGKLKDEANAHMLLGQVLFEYQKWDEAIEAFRKCIDVAEKELDDKKEKQKKKKKKIQDQARKWITYTEGEEERVQALFLKRKALGLIGSS